jgi:hypothetical protein
MPDSVVRATTPMDRSLKALLADRPGLFPVVLAERFPRILANIESRLGSNELAAYLRDLKFNDRGTRQGFPPEVLSELMTLESLNDQIINAHGAQPAAPWEEEAVHKQHAPEKPKQMSGAFAATLEKADIDAVQSHLFLG